MPAYLNALTGKSTYCYCKRLSAKRASEWMGGIFRFLGLMLVNSPRVDRRGA